MASNSNSLETYSIQNIIINDDETETVETDNEHLNVENIILNVNSNRSSIKRRRNDFSKISSLNDTISSKTICYGHDNDENGHDVDFSENINNFEMVESNISTVEPSEIDQLDVTNKIQNYSFLCHVISVKNVEDTESNPAAQFVSKLHSVRYKSSNGGSDIDQLINSNASSNFSQEVVDIIRTRYNAITKKNNNRIENSNENLVPTLNYSKSSQSNNDLENSLAISPDSCTGCKTLLERVNCLEGELKQMKYLVEYQKTSLMDKTKRLKLVNRRLRRRESRITKLINHKIGELEEDIGILNDS